MITITIIREHAIRLEEQVAMIYVSSESLLKEDATEKIRVYVGHQEFTHEDIEQTEKHLAGIFGKSHFCENTIMFIARIVDKFSDYDGTTLFIVDGHEVSFARVGCECLTIPLPSVKQIKDGTLVSKIISTASFLKESQQLARHYYVAVEKEESAMDESIKCKSKLEGHERFLKAEVRKLCLALYDRSDSTEATAKKEQTAVADTVATAESETKKEDEVAPIVESQDCGRCESSHEYDCAGQVIEPQVREDKPDPSPEKPKEDAVEVRDIRCESEHECEETTEPQKEGSAVADATVQCWRTASYWYPGKCSEYIVTTHKEEHPTIPPVVMPTLQGIITKLEELSDQIIALKKEMK